MEIKILNGDCIEEMKKLPENSVDAIICDPPYELGFMGKKWDNLGIAYNIDMWKEAFRILKPGAYLLSFGGTRTYHRMASAIEDAGFEIRDCIEWVYGSGFPKSLNVGKAVDKMQGKEPIVIGKRTDGRYGSKFQDGNNQFVNAENNKRKEVDSKIGLVTIPATEQAKQWEGWGTALKPSHEPIVMARKPLSEKTVAENVLKWGTGGINVDGCRVEAEPELAKNWDRKAPAGFGNGLMNGGLQTGNFIEYKPTGRFPANLIHDGSEEVLGEFPDTKTQGHWSKHEGISGSTIGAFAPKYTGVGEKDKLGGSASRFFQTCEFTEEDYPCFFYTAKASKSERNEGCEELEEKPKTEEYAGRDTRCSICDKFFLSTNNPCNCNEKEFGPKSTRIKNPTNKNNHPTVKPVKLMEYLIKLVTPKGGTVLDCFLGSGTTGVACAKLGVNFIGIEKESEYVKIAEARIKPYLVQERL